METKKIPPIEITELFLVKADWNRTFMATITREKTDDGKEYLYGSVIIHEGKAWSVGSEEDLGTYLDDICSLKLDYGLHEKPGITLKIAGEDFFLN